MGGSGGRGRHRGLREERGPRTDLESPRRPRPHPCSGAPFCSRGLQKLEAMRPDSDASVHATGLVIALARFYLRLKSSSGYRSSFEVVTVPSESRIFHRDV